jgi:alpha-L-arabinofuranosidase
MMSRPFFNRFVALVFLCALCGVFSAFGQSTLSLNVGGATYTINKALYGGLMENFGRCIYHGVYDENVPNTLGMRNDVIAGFKECGIGCIEWPGGCYADNYVWTDGLAQPRSSRPGGVYNQGLGTVEYFTLCSLTGAIPYITANIQNANYVALNASWLNYIDTNSQHPEWKTMLKYWKIGNEEWGSCGNMSASSMQTAWTAAYNAETASQRSRMLHIMDGGSGGGWVGSDCQFAVGKTDPTGISDHRYSVTDWNNMGPSSGFTLAQYYAQLQQAWGTNSTVVSAENTMASSDPNYKVALCFDEWGAWYAAVGGMGGSFNWSTVRDAVIVGMHLNIFNNHCRRVKMALAAQPVNAIQALMLTQTSSPYGMKKTPAFYVFKMFKPHQNATMVPTTLTTGTNQNIPILNASASIDSNKVLHISVVNTHDATNQSLTITLSGTTTVYKSVSGEIVNGASITSGITSFTTTDTVTLKPFTDVSLSGSTITTTIPAHGVVMLTVSPNDVGAVSREAVRNTAPFSIFSAAGGKIIVNHAVDRKSSIRLSLFGIDGRSMVESFNGSIEPGLQSIVWTPKRLGMGKKVYVVKMESGEVTKSQKVVLAR